MIAGYIDPVTGHPMPSITVLTEAELRHLVPLDAEAVVCVEDAFHALATKDVVMPPIMGFEIHEFNGEVDVKTAYVPGLEHFAIKMSPGFFDNPKLGLPSLNGLMVVFESRTGIVSALLLDNGYLTDTRTAAAGAVAASHLARRDASSVAVLGAGGQARSQLAALTLVRPVADARIWARDPAKAVAVAMSLSEELEIPITAVNDIPKAIEGADIIVTATPSGEPLLTADMLEPGQHITAMGSDADYKSELAPDVLPRANLYVADSLAQVRIRGELRAAIAAGTIARDAVFPELGAIIAGQAEGRTSPEQITIADLTGTGVQDTAIATLATARAKAANAGTIIES